MYYISPEKGTDKIYVCITYLSWQILLISKLSTIIGKIKSRPGSDSKVWSIFFSVGFFKFNNLD